MGFVDRGGGRESKGRSLRRSKKNPGAAAARTRPSTNAADNDAGKRIPPPAPPHACVAALERFLTLQRSCRLQLPRSLGMNARACCTTTTTTRTEARTGEATSSDAASASYMETMSASEVYVRAACRMRTAAPVSNTSITANASFPIHEHVTQATSSTVKGATSHADNDWTTGCMHTHKDTALSPYYIDACVSILSRKLQDDIPGVLRRAYEEAGLVALLCWSSVQSRQEALVEFCRSYHHVILHQQHDDVVAPVAAALGEAEEGEDEEAATTTSESAVTRAVHKGGKGATRGSESTDTEEGHTSQARRVHFAPEVQDCNSSHARSLQSGNSSLHTPHRNNSNGNSKKSSTCSLSSPRPAYPAANHTSLHNDALLDESSTSTRCSLYCLVGVHMDSVDRTHHKVHEQWMSEIRSLATQPGVLGILSGLDLSRDAATHFSQELLMKEGWRVAGERQLPLVLHIQCSPHSADRAAELLHELLKEFEDTVHEGEDVDNNNNSDSVKNHASTMVAPTAVVLYDGIHVLAHSTALQQLVRTHRPICEELPHTTPVCGISCCSPAAQGAHIPFYLMLSSNGLCTPETTSSSSTTTVANEKAHRETAYVHTRQQQLWQSLMRQDDDSSESADHVASASNSLTRRSSGRESNKEESQSNAAALLTQLLMGSDSPWHTPPNIPDSYLREQSNEPANMPYAVTQLHACLRQAVGHLASQLYTVGCANAEQQQQEDEDEDEEGCADTEEFTCEGERGKNNVNGRPRHSLVAEESVLHRDVHDSHGRRGVACGWQDMTESELSNVLFVNFMHVFFAATVSQVQSRLERHMGRVARVKDVDTEEHDDTAPAAAAASGELQQAMNHTWTSPVDGFGEDVVSTGGDTAVVNESNAPVEVTSMCAPSGANNKDSTNSNSNAINEDEMASNNTTENRCGSVCDTANDAVQAREKARRDELQALLRAAAQERELLMAEQSTQEAAREAATAAEKLRNLEESRRKRKKNVKANNRSNFTHFRNKNFAPRQSEGGSGVAVTASMVTTMHTNATRHDDPHASVKKEHRNERLECEGGGDAVAGRLIQDVQYQDLQLMHSSGSSEEDADADEGRAGYTAGMAMTRAQRKKKNKAMRQQRQRQGGADDSSSDA